MSVNNQPSQARPTSIDINCNKTLFYACSDSVNKCRGSFNTIDDPYTPVCVPNKVKNMILKVYNFISGVNETRYLVQHE